MLNDNDLITGVVVVWRTTELIKKCLEAFRALYPSLKLIIVDNASGGDCTEYLKSFTLNDKGTKLLILPRNIGHGYGLNRGMNYVETPYAFIFDSDTIFKKYGLLEKMRNLMCFDTWGVGHVHYVTHKDRRYANCSKSYPYGAYKCMRGYATLINMKRYKQFPKFMKGASALGEIAEAIDKCDKPERLLVHFDAREYVDHLYGETRKQFGLPIDEDLREDEKIEIIQSTC